MAKDSIIPSNTNPSDGGDGSIDIQVSPGISAQYCNTVRVNVTDDAVILQMLYIRPGTRHAVLLSEVALSPQHAMRLADTIDKTVKRHFTQPPLSMS